LASRECNARIAGAGALVQRFGTRSWSEELWAVRLGWLGSHATSWRRGLHSSRHDAAAGSGSRHVDELRPSTAIQSQEHLQARSVCLPILRHAAAAWRPDVGPRRAAGARRWVDLGQLRAGVFGLQ